MHVMNEMRNRVHVELKILAFFGASSLEVLPFVLCIHWETQTQKWSWRNHSLFVDFPSLLFFFWERGNERSLIIPGCFPMILFLPSQAHEWAGCLQSLWRKPSAGLVRLWWVFLTWSLWPHATSSHGYQCVLVRSARKLWAYTQDLRLLQGCYEIETTEKARW